MKGMDKILIFYATAGIGHKKAAFAIKEAFDENGVRDVLLKDVLDYTNKFFKFSYNAIYIFLVKYLPTMWGIFYYLLDNPQVYALVKPIRRLTNHLNSKRFVKFLLETKPQTVITTHFFPVEVIANLKNKGLIKTRLVAVITDYKSHIFWFAEDVDYYIVGADYTRDDLIKRGISPGKIRVFGIPCEKSFSERKDRNALCSKIGLKRDTRTVFVLGGGFGVGPIKELVTYLDDARTDFQCIVVCGYNKKLYRIVRDIAGHAKHDFKVFGFVDNVDELMAVSDILISKPGGVSLTEALNSELPMIVISPIPGQEMRNYKFLESNNAALKIKSPKEIVNVIEELFNSNKLDLLRENIDRIRHTDSAERIVEILV